MRARLAAMDAKVDVLVREAAKLAPPTPPQSPEVTTLAKAMADPLYHFPTGSTVSLDWDDDEELIATGLTIEGRFWSIENIVKLGLINVEGLGCGADGRQSIWLCHPSMPITYGHITKQRLLEGPASNH
jgi:hypothetical protein